MRPPLHAEVGPLASKAQQVWAASRASAGALAGVQGQKPHVVGKAAGGALQKPGREGRVEGQKLQGEAGAGFFQDKTNALLILKGTKRIPNILPRTTHHGLHIAAFFYLSAKLPRRFENPFCFPSVGARTLH